MIEQRREEVRRLLEDAEKFCGLAEKGSDLGRRRRRPGSA
jgi:hypothetical protein